MLKKIIYNIFLISLLIPSFVEAGVGSLVKLGNKYYDSLEEAIANVKEGEVITLISDVDLDEGLKITKNININLNDNNITAKEQVLYVDGGILNLTGKGTIKETEPNYGAVMVRGSIDPNDMLYSVVNIGENVTLEGWSGIFITHRDSKSYGVEVNFSGKINSIKDKDGKNGTGIYVNGNIKDSNNYPKVNILDGATVSSTGNGIYIAGYSTFNINEAKISGSESGIGIKSGILNIDGATIIGTGPDLTPSEGYNNGIKASGSAIQIESNNGYAGEIELNIDSGSFISKNSNVIYEYIGKGNHSQVVALDISGGQFISEKGKNVFSISNSLKEYHNNFISGGEYSSNPNEYLKPGYKINKEDNIYEVIKSTFIDVFAEKNNTNNRYIGIIAIIILILILIAMIYPKRKKILKY